MRSERRLLRLESVIRNRQPDLTVVLENVHDPHNVSAVLRSCDASGVAEIQLVYNEDKFPKLGKKSSASAKKWVEHRDFDSVTKCYDRLRKEGFTVLATQLGKKAVSLYDLDLTKKTAIVFGNEHRGVSDEAATQADGVFMIPMFGMIQSLNISVACAVTLFEAVRQRILKGGYPSRAYDDKEVKKLLRKWAMK
ncbi:MAG TPA: RNA methyltransferase [Bacteroidota bacterium]|nr:RNA methyltransferase [Bacteroidota bacterium]